MATTAVPTARRGVATPRRLALGAAGLVALAGAVATIGWLAPALWLVPDLTMLAGISGDMPRDGRLAPRAVPYYNAAHTLAGPLALTMAGIVSGPIVLGLGLTWLSHVLLDRAVGYGLRAPDGSRRG